jgi:hypothetical protein
MMRSPPPPAPSHGGSGYGTPFGGHINQGAGGPNQFAPAFGGFMNDPTAQMGFQLGKTAAMAGQEYLEQNVRSVSWLQLPEPLLTLFIG